MEDWRTMIQVEDIYIQYKKRIVQVLNIFDHMWNGHLGHMRSLKHRIDLLPGSRPVNQHPRRAVRDR